MRQDQGRAGRVGKRRTGVAVLSAALVLGASAAPAAAKQERPSVRPGSWIQERINDQGRLGSSCTAGFLLRGDDGHKYLFVSGHCARADNVANPSEHTTFQEGQPYDDDPETDTPTVAIYDGETQRRLGFAVYVMDGYRLQEQQRFHDSAGRTSPVGGDFALVRLDRHVKADPEMCFWGGPTGIYDELSAEPVVVRTFTNGFTGQPRLGGPVQQAADLAGVPSRAYTVPAKTAVLPHSRHRDFAHASMASAPGDSGSPIMTADGRAVGTINFGAAVVQDGVVSAGPTYVIRMGPAVAWMGRQLGLRLRLMTAPLREHPVGTTVGREECR